MQANSSPLLLRSAPDTTRTQRRRLTPTCKRHSALLFVLASLMFVSDLWMVYSEPLLDSLVVSPSSATLVNSCGIGPTLHWLPVRQRIFYRVSTIAWRCILGVVPAYFSELFVVSSFCPGRRSLRWASRSDYLIPRSYTATKQNRVFSAAGPSIWNGLPLKKRSLPHDFSSSFYSLLKTFLFARAWARSASE